MNLAVLTLVILILIFLSFGIVLLLRDVLARSLFEKYQGDFALLNHVLDAYEPAANRIANTVAVSFVAVFLIRRIYVFAAGAASAP